MGSKSPTWYWVGRHKGIIESRWGLALFGKVGIPTEKPGGHWGRCSLGCSGGPTQAWNCWGEKLRLALWSRILSPWRELRRGSLCCSGHLSIWRCQECGVTTKDSGKCGVEPAWVSKTSCVLWVTGEERCSCPNSLGSRVSLRGQTLKCLHWFRSDCS